MPDRKEARNHLIERNCRRESLSLQVPSRRLAEGQEWVEIAGGAGADVLWAASRQGEVEEHQVQGIAAADGGDPDVVGLDVAVSDAFAFEDDYGFQEILAEAFKQIKAEPTFLSQSLGERRGLPLLTGVQFNFARRIKNERGPVREVDYAVATDDQWAIELLEDLSLVANAIIVVGVNRDLGDELLVLLANQ